MSMNSATTGGNNTTTADPVCLVNVALSPSLTFEAFENTPLLDFIHRQAPRFGRPNDVLLYLTGTEEEQTQYVRGLFASSIAIFSFFIVWTVVLIYAKRKGPERFGWLSGRRRRRLARNDDAVAAVNIIETSDDNSKLLSTQLLKGKEAPHPSTDIKSPEHEIIVEEHDDNKDQDEKNGTKNDATSSNPPDDDDANKTNSSSNAIAVAEEEVTKKDETPSSDHVDNKVDDPADSKSYNDGQKRGEQQQQQQQASTSSNLMEGDHWIEKQEHGGDGSGAMVPSDIVQKEEGEEEDNNGDGKEDGRLLRRQQHIMKLLVCFACCVIVVSSIMLCVHGGDALSEAMTSANESTRYALSLLYEGALIMGQMVDGTRQLQQDTLELMEGINTMCPNIREEICTDLQDSASCDVRGVFSGDPFGVSGGAGGQAFLALVDWYSSNQTVVYNVAQVESGLGDVISVVESIDETLSNVNWSLYLAVAFAIPLSLLCLWIVVAMFRKTDSKTMKYFQSGCIIPSIGLFAILSYIFTGFFIFGSMAISDVCIDDPDARVLAVAEYYSSQLSPFIYQFILFYMSKCEIQPREIADQIDALQTGVGITFDFAQEVSEQIAASCEGSGPDFAAELTVRVNELFCTLTNLSVAFRKLFQCQTWYPLYQLFMVDTVCYSVTPAFTWLASTQFVILMMTLVILTLRVVIWDLDDNTATTTAAIVEDENRDIMNVVQQDEPKNESVVEETKGIALAQQGDEIINDESSSSLSEEVADLKILASAEA